ncbi:MAG: hypothetical protein EPN56_01690 [Rhodanobacter sp.]|nr:MAG: hypothetical protein EPN78_03495 [Rhodanobacter sp.]TAM14526.1 MAG: hypothetical protein EPN66_01455 [Rhodanobacter sp.]TAM37317.1 MAG: hypothetical protein EPN56_01690 [Rhodanobacter sp.]
MKPLMVAGLSVLALTLAAGANAQTKASHAAYHPLRPVSQCLRTDRINEWHVVDARTLTVRTGPDRYLVKLAAQCQRLSYGPPTLRFHTSPAGKAVAPFSICGEVGETVSSPNQPPCAIQSVRQIDRAQFDRLSAKARRSGSAAGLPPRDLEKP